MDNRYERRFTELLHNMRNLLIQGKEGNIALLYATLHYTALHCNGEASRGVWITQTAERKRFCHHKGLVPLCRALDASEVNQRGYKPLSFRNKSIVSKKCQFWYHRTQFVIHRSFNKTEWGLKFNLILRWDVEWFRHNYEGKLRNIASKNWN